VGSEKSQPLFEHEKDKDKRIEHLTALLQHARSIIQLQEFKNGNKEYFETISQASNEN